MSGDPWTALAPPGNPPPSPLLAARRYTLLALATASSGAAASGCSFAVRQYSRSLPQAERSSILAAFRGQDRSVEVTPPTRGP